MTNNITKCPQRLNLVTILLKYYIINDKRHILVLSKTKQYLRDIEDKIKKAKNNGADLILFPENCGFMGNGKEMLSNAFSEADHPVFLNAKIAAKNYNINEIEMKNFRDKLQDYLINKSTIYLFFHFGRVNTD